MISPRFLLLLALSLCAALPSGAVEPTVEQALEHMIDAYGGEQNLAGLDQAVQHWDMMALASGRTGTDRRSISLPGRLRVELDYPDKQEARLLDGEQAYMVLGRMARPANPFQRDAMRLQLMRLYSPLALRARQAGMTLARQAEWLVLTLREAGLQTDYHVNPQSWRIERVTGSLSMAGTSMEFVTEYSDFEFVQGVLVHRKENKFAGGVNTARLQLRSIELGVQFEPGHFAPAPPDGADESRAGGPLPGSVHLAARGSGPALGPSYNGLATPGTYTQQ